MSQLGQVRQARHLRHLTISRRQFLAGSAGMAAVIVGALPARAKARPHTFTHGAFEITVLSDGHLEFPASIHGLGQPPEAVQALLQAAGLDREVLKPAANPALIRAGSDLILVDTGSGDGFQPSAGRMLENLAAAGIEPGAITRVVFTHAHPDHIWGTTASDGTLLFPNAAYYVSAVERDFWMTPDLESTMPREMHPLVAGARANLEAVADRLTVVRPGDDIVSGISVVDTAGHTPGHISLALEGEDGLLIPADAITEPAIYFAHPEWLFAFDMDGGQAVASRKAILDRAATDRMKMLGFHWPYPGTGFAERHGSAYRFVPLG